TSPSATRTTSPPPPARPPAATASSWTWAATATRRRPSPRTRYGRCPVPRWPPRSPGRSWTTPNSTPVAGRWPPSASGSRTTRGATRCATATDWPSPGGASPAPERDASSEDRAGSVLGGLRVPRGDLLHLPDDLGHLGARGAGEREPVREQRVQPRPVQRDPLVGGQPVQQRVLPGALAHGERGRHRVLLDDLVRGLPPDALADGRHQHLGGPQERQVAVEFGLDHRREGAELVQHRE